VNPTRNDLSKKARKAAAALLNARLADGLDLQMRAKQAHWNVKGPHFQALHLLFDGVASAVSGWNDDLAERAVQLGGIAEGTVVAVATASSLEAYPPFAVDGRAHLEAMAASLATFGASVRAAVDEATRLGDAGTADLLTGVSRGADKQLWLVEAHLQEAM
jgi:starvation-inducible DNA-binding protein